MLLLRQDVLKETLEEAYELGAGEVHTAETEEFRQLLEQLAPGKDDQAVQNALLQVYQFHLDSLADEWLAGAGWHTADRIKRRRRRNRTGYALR